MNSSQNILLSFLFIICLPISAQISNVNYLPEDRSYEHLTKTDSFYPTNGVLTTNYLNHLSSEYRQALMNAIAAEECGLAENDKAGHWGEAGLGFQLSLRSRTNVFVLGSPIPVLSIIRNTTTNIASIYFDPIEETSFSIRDENGNAVQYEPDISQKPMGTVGVGYRRILPCRQIRTEFNLNDRLSKAKAGIYNIQASRTVMEITVSTNSKPAAEKTLLERKWNIPPLEYKYSNIQSGVLTIRLVDP